MRVTFTPLVADARGSVADATFSRWKGTNYVRSRVTPKNPNTDPQKATRGRVGRLNALYRYLPALFRAAWEKVGAAMQVSGWNEFFRQNFALLKAESPIQTTPANTAVEPVASFIGETVETAPQIELTWVNGFAVGTNAVQLLVSETGSDRLEVPDPHTAPVSAESVIIECAKEDTSYDVWLAVEDAVTHELSISLVAEGILTGHLS